MFAVIKTGGKQYRVAADRPFEVEKLAGEAGDTVTFADVLMLGGDDAEGRRAAGRRAPRCSAEIVEQKRGRKVIIFKKRRRQNSRRKNGHRQDFTLVRITDILAERARPRGAGRPTSAAADGGAPRPAAKKPRAKRARRPKRGRGSGRVALRQERHMAHKKAGGSSRNGRDSAGSASA